MAGASLWNIGSWFSIPKEYTATEMLAQVAERGAGKISAGMQQVVGDHIAPHIEAGKTELKNIQAEFAKKLEGNVDVHSKKIRHSLLWASGIVGVALIIGLIGAAAIANREVEEIENAPPRAPQPAPAAGS